MAYVRKKNMRGKTIYQLVEGYREDGKVKQRVLSHLGECKTVERALWWWPRRIVKLRLCAHEARDTVAFVPKSFKDDRGRGRSNSFLGENGEMVRRKASPHTYSAYYKRTGMGLYDRYWEQLFDWELHKHYWDHVDHAEKLEREANNIEDRLVKLCQIHNGTAEGVREAMQARLERIAAAKQRMKARREMERL